ncbi:glycosyltransferase family 4 protein [Tundrisphaera sp. TA3]|uniref:glycosyltransferase family 4 protein n=1 Tax=Tundrisphaera sp. TA3 TaxID=3435775 RepID=UPI003EBCFA3C
MRLTLVTETYAPQVNGVSRTLGQLVRHMEEAGDEVQVVHPDYGQPPRGDRDVLVRTRALPFYREVGVALPPFGRVHRAIEAFRPDLIHVATEATLGLSALRYALRRGIPVVSSFHTNFDQYGTHYGLGWATSLIWRYLRRFHNRTRETYVPSRTTIADLDRRGFERLVLWPRGVDGTLFRPDRPGRDRVRAELGFGPDDAVIGHVSRLAAEKNVGELAEALDAVRRARPAVRFLFVGDGPARIDLQRRMGDGARFVGYRTGADLADHYAAADLFAFASRTETFGNVVLEALASGLPAVAIRAGGVADIIRDGATGCLIPPDAPPGRMAEALIDLVDDPTRRRRMAEAARDYALDQSWDAIMGRLRDRYLAAAGRLPEPVAVAAG